MCLTNLHNIQQDLINFIPGFSSLLMQMIFFLLLKQTVPDSDMRYFRASVIYMYTNPRVPRFTGKTRITGKTTEIPERPKNNRGLFPVLILQALFV